MRICLKASAIVLALIALQPVAAQEEFCTMPVLSRAQLTIVEVADVRHPNCGVVIIEGRYLRTEKLAQKQGEIRCTAEACAQYVEYSVDMVPYPVVYLQKNADRDAANDYPRIAKVYR